MTCDYCKSVHYGFPRYVDKHLCHPCYLRYKFVPDYIPMKQWKKYIEKINDKIKCYFCLREWYINFYYRKLNSNKDSKLRVCKEHWLILLEGHNLEYIYLPTKQRELVAVERLKKKYNIT